MSATDHSINTQRIVHKNLFASFFGVELSFPSVLFQAKKALPQAGPDPPTVVPLPYEIYLAILRRFIKSIIYAPGIRQYRLERDTFTQRHKLVSVMLVSRAFANLVRDGWNRQWPASRLLTGCSWMLARPNVFFGRFIQPIDLSAFARLRFASLDFTDAFMHRDHAWHLITLVAKLPSSLKEIEFLRVHAPELEVIDLVSQLCPDVIALRVVFCTMFNNPRCLWWAKHQDATDHGHYLRGHELEEIRVYATTVGRALRRLPRLKHLHLGVYFASIQAVNNHRFAADHIKCHSVRDSTRWIDQMQVQSLAQFQAVWAVRYPNVPLPNIELPCLADQKFWEAPCAQCYSEWFERTKHAESLAASILVADCPSLRKVSFASFVAEKRTSPSEWEVRQSNILFLPSAQAPDQRSPAAGQYPMGTRIIVWTKPIDAPAGSAQGHVFVRSDTNWEHAGHARMIPVLLRFE